MFNGTSMAGSGLIITLIETILKLTGVEFPDGSVSAGINGIIAFVGLILLVWGQVRRKDLKFGLIRK